jgi:hypothetical protein
VRGEEVLLVLTILLIVSAVLVLLMAMHGRRRSQEMLHLERLAMIERGLMPAPEADPELFEQKSGFEPAQESRSAQRWRTAGISMIGFGLALIFLIGIASGAPGVGIGIGGAFAMVGGAFLVNSRLLGGSEVRPVRPVTRQAPRRPDPPPPIEPSL